MWMLPPEGLCRKHLLGEHVELHMLVGTLLRGRSIEGFIRKGLLEPAALLTRHAALAAEMEQRGYKHKSPLPESVLEAIAALPPQWRNAVVDPAVALRDLTGRCPDCRKRHENDMISK